MTTQITAFDRIATAYNEAAKVGKVLDVSALNQDGTGSRKVKVPKTARGTKKWVENVPVISDNYNSYALAMVLLGKDFEPYAQLYYQLHGEGKAEAERLKQAEAAKPNPRLGAPIGAFPYAANTPAPVSAATVKVTPLGSTRSPKAASPKAAKSPKAVKTPRGPVYVQGPDLAVPPQPRVPPVRTPKAAVPAAQGRIKVPLPTARR